VLDNAIKWSPSGGTVDLRLADGTLKVRDRGPGIAEADLPHVFDRFYRADSARSLSGSGLGLAIVKQTLDDHGGEVAAGNAEGGGCAHVRALLCAHTGCRTGQILGATDRSTSGD